MLVRVESWRRILGSWQSWQLSKLEWEPLHIVMDYINQKKQEIRQKKKDWKNVTHMKYETHQIWKHKMITEAEELTINLWFPIHSVLKPPNTFESRESNQSDFWPLKRESYTFHLFFWLFWLSTKCGSYPNFDKCQDICASSSY
jgi:hypothetical protein